MTSLSFLFKNIYALVDLCPLPSGLTSLPYKTLPKPQAKRLKLPRHVSKALPDLPLLALLFTMTQLHMLLTPLVQRPDPQRPTRGGEGGGWSIHLVQSEPLQNWCYVCGLVLDSLIILGF